MKNLKMNPIMLSCLFFSIISMNAHAKNYYIDQVAGSDNNNGTTPSSAYKSIKKVNRLKLSPGDSILFKRGGHWTGTLKPNGNGARKIRIVIGAYGEGVAPIIDAEGKKGENDFMSAAILLYNQEYWEIRDIEVRNFEKGNPVTPVKKAGILVLAKDIGTLHDFKFENLMIKDVNGFLKTRENGGLFLNIIADEIPEKRVPTNFDGIYLNNCYFLNVDRGGFLNQSFWRKRDFNTKFGEICKDSKVNTWFPSKNILIENCKFEDVGGNGLVTRVADSPVVQHNLFVKCSSRTTGNASYPYNCDNALWQYNEACYTVHNEGEVDASGFDSDYMCKNTFIQYNYSHHNGWGGLLVCSWGKVKNSFNDGTIIRNNIFQDEKHHMIRFSGNITNTEISNNLFVASSEIDDVLLWYKHWGKIWPDKTVLKENIFFNSGAKRFLNLGETSNNSISGNRLIGSSFSDYTDFNSIQNEKELNSKIEKIKKVGARGKFAISKAKEVTDIMWGTVDNAYGGHAVEIQKKTDFSVVPFGSGGQLKMIYDRRQRPQAIFINNEAYIVYNGGASMNAVDREKTYPFVISFDPETESLSPPIQLGTKGSRDQHYCPIIWADNNDFLHILSGCHKTSGTHLMSKKAADIGNSVEDWSTASQIRNSLSYTTVYNIYDNKKMIYFRTGEHRSSWSYLISDDEGKTWSGPEKDVTDLNMGGETAIVDDPIDLNEMSSYQSCLPSVDGKFLHVVFCSYDDNKTSVPEKFYNPRYKTKKNLGLKYNLYYAKINLQTYEAKNFGGETVKTPIDFDNANAKCKIWDTDWRGAGIPPDIMIDENDNPAFLHVLSEDTPEKYNYYYVRYVNNEWKQTVITSSNDDWNSCYLRQDESGVLHAYLIVGNHKFIKGEGGKMDSRGGGNIEEWISTDKGNTWKRIRDLTPNALEYAGWKFNNIQPIKDPKGNVKDGMLLFYGWKGSKLSKAKGFLIIE